MPKHVLYVIYFFLPIMGYYHAFKYMHVFVSCNDLILFWVFIGLTSRDELEARMLC